MALGGNWRKYWHSLVIPYILYNVIIYPYWLLKYYLANGTMPDFFAAMRPIIGPILLQHENAFAEPLDGPLWYLPAILIMHVTIDLCRKTKHQHLIMIALCLVSFFLYAANKYWYFAPNLTPMGLMRNLPYYYIGYVMGHYHLFRDTNTKRDAAGCLICLTSSILLFAWHLDAFNDGQHLLHIALFYPANIGFLLGVLYGCKLMNSIKSNMTDTSLYWHSGRRWSSHRARHHRQLCLWSSVPYQRHHLLSMERGHTAGYPHHSPALSRHSTWQTSFSCTFRKI